MNASPYPSVDALVRAADCDAPHALVVEAARSAIAERRASGRPATVEDLQEAVRERVRRSSRPSLRRVLNATGVVLHTNLGRAPLAAVAIERIAETAQGYSNLELDLGAGRRGSRQAHLEPLLCALTGARAALCVNNGAAAVLLALAAHAAGREVVVSRGELVEIGDGFRIPDVLAQSGARLREVGTTNRTRLADYEQAIGEQTAALLRVHPSNFRIVGFTERVELPALAGLARSRGLALIEDLGSGALLDAGPLAGEPTAREAVAGGADLVTFSGDKLLGGPQAGVIVGSAEAVDACRRHPLARALRLDRLSVAALEATLTLYREPARALREIPALRAACEPAGVVRARAGRLAERLGGRVVETVGRIGGGALPLTELESFGVALDGPPDPLAAALRGADPPVLARIVDGACVLDCRTLRDDELELVSLSGVTRPLTLGTAGHIDHGKTALVRALTGVDTDRLPEEQARGISIDLGYAPLDLPSGRRLSVVDVPGHERFVRTMVAGASGIDLVLLVVACDDGVMPQTREHLDICRLLGIPRAVVALSKRDAVDDDTAALAALDVEELLEPTPYAGAVLVETSAVQGLGLDALRAALDAAAAGLEGRTDEGPARLHVDRSFSLRGIGAVVTGTLWSGSIGAGDRLALEPGGAEARVRSVEVHDQPQERAGAGQRVAASLVGLRQPAVRGQVLITPGAFAPSFRLDVRLLPLDGAPELAHGASVRVLHGTADVEGRAVLLGGGLAQLRLRRPLVAARGDHVVLRATSPPATVAGGVVLDPAPARHAGSVAALARLALLESGGPEELARAGLADAAAPVPLAGVARPGLLDPAPAQAALEALVGRGEAVALGPADEHRTWLSATRYAALRDGVAAALAARAGAEPLDPGLPLAGLVPDGPGREALLERLELDGVLVRERAQARAPGTRADARAVHAAAAEQLLAGLEQNGSTPPDLPTLAARSGLAPREFDTLCAALEREGAIVRFGGDLAYTAERFAETRAAVVAQCEAGGSVTLAQLRDSLGTSRRVAQALLERLDADGVTRRVGDERVLRRRGRPA